MNKREQQERQMIQAIRCCSVPPWWVEAPTVPWLAWAIRNVGFCASGSSIQLMTVASALWEANPEERVERAIDGPSMDDIAPLLVGLDTPLCLD